MKTLNIIGALIFIISISANAQSLNNKEFEIWSGSIKFNMFTETPFQHESTIKEFEIWNSSKKFYQFSENTISTNAEEQELKEESQKNEESSVENQNDNENSQNSIPINNIEKIKIFPNPADDHINVSLSFPDFTDAEIILYNSIGKPIFKTFVTEKKQFIKIIEVSSYDRGIYFLEIIADGKKTIKRIVIK